MELARAVAGQQHGAISRRQLASLGVARWRRQRWIETGFIIPVGPQSYIVHGSADTWHRALWLAQMDLDGRGFIAGRSAARLHGLDGFTSDVIELLVPRAFRSLQSPWAVHSTSATLTTGCTQVLDGLRLLNPQRLILEAPIFGFDRSEIENAIDSAVRKKLVSEQRLRTAVVRQHRTGVNGSRILLDALIDAGGESRLERRFLTIVRRAGLPRPTLQRSYRDGQRFVARVDAVFDGNHVVELEGHGNHSSRQQRQADEKRRNALRRQVSSLTVFTYDHVTYESDYVLAELLTLGIRPESAPPPSNAVRLL